jgi:hypothetical protein
LPGRARGGGRASRGEDGSDVIGAPSAELHGSFQRRDEGRVTVRGAQGEDLADLAGQLGDPGCGGAGQERGVPRR